VIRVVAAPWVLTGEPFAADLAARSTSPAAILEGAVALEGDRIVEVGTAAALAARHGNLEHLDAVLLPAMVNAHLHLELSHLAGRVPGGDGLAGWIERFVAARQAVGEVGAGPAMVRACQELDRAGVAAVGDVTNTLASLGPLAEAGLAGTLFHEVFGSAPERLEAARAAARVIRANHATTGVIGLRVVESPHAVYSTEQAGLLSLLAGPPASIHLAEDPAEREFVATGGGPFGALRRRMGGPPGQPGWARSPVALVASRLSPGWLVVHAVDIDDDDLRALAACGATVVLCPRSNQHISQAVPPLPRLLAAGIPLALGTDSLASCPTLAPLAEVAALRRAFPEVPARAIVPLAWNGAAVGAPAVGRLRPGTSPGLLAAPLHGARPADPFEFLATGEGPLGRHVEWLARHRREVA